jgi:phosphotransferase system enzyme I (PtsI)
MTAVTEKGQAILMGKTVSPGIAFGRGCFSRTEGQGKTHRNIKHVPENTSPLHYAFLQLDSHLTQLIRYAEQLNDDDTASLFKAHQMISEELESEVAKTVDTGKATIKDAIETCFNAYTDYFQNLENEYFSQRADDFTELKHQLLNFLDNKGTVLSCRDYNGCQMGQCVLRNEHILITEDLSSSVAIRINQHTKGIITNKCNPNSHAAVIARSLGIPIVSGIKNPLQCFSHLDNILIDGETGEILTNPDESRLKKIRSRINKPTSLYEMVEPVTGFTVLADIDLHKDVEKAIKVGAEGIGLYRTEFEMLSKDRDLDEEEQREIYQYVIDHMQGKPVSIRLMDLGSDKSSAWLELDEEDNPALGCRGARLLLSRPELLETQARAIAEVSRHAMVDVMYPMISNVGEFLQLKKLFMDAVIGIDNTNIRHGVMFEVPSACINAAALYDVIDFGRIGTNDLVQYLFARDRTSNDFDYIEMVNDPALWQLIASIVDAAQKAKKPLELCGMLVEIPSMIPALIKAGITTVSTPPKNIATVRRVARAFLEDRQA